MASSILRWISRKAAARSPPLPNSLNSCGYGGRSAATWRRRIGTMSGVLCPSTLPSRISPWLMLPPAVEGTENNMLYKFYSLAEDKIISLNKRGRGGEEEEANIELGPGDESELKGSSHGWLALFNPRNCDLFLYNPLSRRYVKLPPIHNLSIPEGNLEGGYGCVTNLIISCSPDEEGCRAMMTFGPDDRLAFCCPGSSTEWTQLYDSDDGGRRIVRCYESFVYSSTQKLFFCLTQFAEFEAWDLQDPSSPRLIPMVVSVDEGNYPCAARSEEELNLKESCRQVMFLVFDYSSGELYHVMRHVMEQMSPDGSYVEDEGEDEDMYPYKTIGFDVYKYDSENNALRYMEGSLDGLAFFIGNNHSFAMRASAFPELKPNSIYFTDVDELIPRRVRTPNPPFGGHDIGIFNYEDGTFSPCYYPCDVKSIRRIIPPPTWFTPSPL